MRAVFLLLIAGCALAVDTIEGLTADGRTDPLAVDRAPVRLGWRIASDVRGTSQTAYQIQVASSRAGLLAGTIDVWDSGKVAGTTSQDVAYAGPARNATATVWWRVRIWNQTGAASAWSDPATWSMGLLDDTAWSGAIWITAPVAADQSPLMRTSFAIAKPVARARLYICGLGYYEAFINGTKVGDAVLEPGVGYHHLRSWYAAHDVTGMVQPGGNVLGVELANGSLRGLTQGGHPSFSIDNAWLSTPRLRCRLLLEFADGTSQNVVSGTSGWTWTPGPVRANDWYRAVTYDARLEIPGWATASVPATGWSAVQPSAKTSATMSARRDPPCRVVETLAPVSMTTRAGTTASGAAATVYAFTFAKNISGWAQLRDVIAPAGTELRIAYYEPTDWTQWDLYICRGGGGETWEPRFTYHGFNRAEVTVPVASGVVLSSANIRARRVHTDLPSTGSFTCSNPVLNRLLDAAILSYLGNYHSIPTDCPTREKAGWMADAHLVAESGMYFLGNRTAYEKWMLDCRDGQIPGGGIPSVVPSAGFSAGSSNAWGGTAWSAAYPMIVWSLYERHGGIDLLQTHYPALRAYADFVATSLCTGNTDPADDGFIVTKTGLGDWGGTNNTDANSERLITTSYHHQIVRIVADCAAALGNSADATAYTARANGIAMRFNARFRTAGQPGSYTEARPARAKACALFQGLVPDGDRQLTADLLKAELTSDWQWMGCLTPRWALQELSRAGHVDTAYAAVARTDRNWARWTESQGLTTLREFWTSGTYNHAFMGMFATWYIEDVLGLRPDPSNPGFSGFHVVPQPPTALSSASGHYDSVRSRIAIAWSRSAGGFALDVTVPANCRATIAVPAAASATVREGGQPLAEVTGLTDLGQAGAHRRVSVGSGRWRFSVSDSTANSPPQIGAVGATTPPVLP